MRVGGSVGSKNERHVRFPSFSVVKSNLRGWEIGGGEHKREHGGGS